MKINSIKTHKDYNIGELVINIDFDVANPSDKPDGDALYYLICALESAKGNRTKI